MKQIRGQQIKGRKGLAHWPALVEEWMMAIERYCRLMNGEDAPYFYTERACVGTLAAAAWRCGRVALEEFQLEKSERRKHAWLGRADLYIASEQSEDFVEAKYEPVSFKANRELNAVFEKGLAEAVADARNSRNGNEKGNFIGVVFYPLYAAAKEENNLDTLIENAIEVALDSSAHLVAWTFPPEMRNYPSEDYFNPGLIMLASNERYA